MDFRISALPVRPGSVRIVCRVGDIVDTSNGYLKLESTGRLVGIIDYKTGEVTLTDPRVTHGTAVYSIMKRGSRPEAQAT